MVLKIGLATLSNFWSRRFKEKCSLLDAVDKAGVDHLFIADHVSFHDGSGTDGFIEVAALSQLHPTLGIMISIYLLPLRHPLPVARQLATMHKVAPARMMFGVGIGGEDRREIEICGVDPSTRGIRTNESLHILRGLMTGERLTYKGDIFEVKDACIRPGIDPQIPIIIGGRSNAALNRTAHYGDGWIASWCSVKRFTEALRSIDDTASKIGRSVDWQHGYQPWVGLADSKHEARSLVKKEMEAFYKIPFEQFEKYTPYGTPEDVSDFLAPYVTAGCSIMNLKVVAATNRLIIQGTSEVASRLRALSPAVP